MTTSECESPGMADLGDSDTRPLFTLGSGQIVRPRVNNTLQRQCAKDTPQHSNTPQVDKDERQQAD